MQSLKHWRAAEPAGLWAKQLQAAWEHSPAFHSHLHSIVLLALQHDMSVLVKEAEGLPFITKGDPASPKSYRCIQLANMLRKIIALTISKHLQALGE